MAVSEEMVKVALDRTYSIPFQIISGLIADDTLEQLVQGLVQCFAHGPEESWTNMTKVTMTALNMILEAPKAYNGRSVTFLVCLGLNQGIQDYVKQQCPAHCTQEWYDNVFGGLGDNAMRYVKGRLTMDEFYSVASTLIQQQEAKLHIDATLLEMQRTTNCSPP